MITQLLSVLGTVVLLHAGYSANQYKTLVSAQGVGGDDAGRTLLPPADVIIECAISFVLILAGQLLPLSLESVQLAPSKKFMTFTDRFEAPELRQFDHRGREFYKRAERGSTKR